MFYGKLADRVRYFKEDAKVESMCKAIEEMRNQEREEVTREFVVRMIRDGETSVEKMARYSGLSLDERNRKAGSSSCLIIRCAYGAEKLWWNWTENITR